MSPFKNKAIYTTVLSLGLLLTSSSSKAAQDIVVTNNYFGFKAGMHVNAFDHPIDRYIDSKTGKACTGVQENCIPVYSFYALTDPFRRDASTKQRYWATTPENKSVAFWGSAGDKYSSCNTINGPATGPSGDISLFSYSLQLTGIATEPQSSNQWSPHLPQSAGCPTKAQEKNGGSFVVYNSSAIDGGFGLFTLAGNALGNFFWHPTTPEQANGVNAHVMGTYLTLLGDSDFADTQTYHPFSGKTTDPSRLIFALRTVQSVMKAKIAGDPSTIAQVHQLVQVNFLNPDCVKNVLPSNPKAVCVVQYLWTTYINRREYAFRNNEYVAVPVETKDFALFAKIWFDPGQGGMAIISGPLKDKTFGTMLTYLGNSYDLWTSWGHASVFERAVDRSQPAFADEKFQVNMSWQQFTTALRILAAKLYNQNNNSALSPDQIPGAFIQSLFGTQWDNPAIWVVSHAAAAQENYNKRPNDETVYIGGNVKSFEMLATPFQ